MVAERCFMVAERGFLGNEEVFPRRVAELYACRLAAS